MAIKNNSVLIQFIKDEVRKKFGMDVLYAADCQILSEEIQIKTKRQLSVSTLKRFFGIVRSPYAPSKFTLDTLILYLDLENGHESLNHTIDLEGINYLSDPWENVKKLTDEITYTSLNSIKNRIKPKYKNFPLRKFAKKRMDDFLRSPKKATAFIAPDGMGKSTIFAQLTETFFIGADAQYPEDIVCLIDGSIYVSLIANKQHFQGLSNLIEYNPLNRFNLTFFNNPELVKGKLVLMIEGIDDIFFASGRPDAFTDNLLNIILSYEKLTWFKLILSCTPAIWRRFSERIQKNEMLKSLWFDVTLRGTDDELVNIPMLTNKEIELIFRQKKIACTMEELCFNHPEILGIINNPYMLNLFFTNYQHNGEMQDIELLNDFVKVNILSPPYQKEKYAIIKMFFGVCENGKKGMEVNKEDLKLTSSMSPAYFELIRTGIFHEYSFTDKYLTLNTYVQFSNLVLFAYYLANVLIKENQTNGNLFKDVITGYTKSPHLQCNILKYIIKILFREEKTELLKDIFSVLDNEGVVSEFHPPASCKILINVIGLEIRKNEKLRNILVPYFAQSNTGRKLYFEQFFDIDSLVLFSGNNLSYYLQNDLTEDAVQYVRYLRFMQYFLSENHELCRAEYQKSLIQKFKLVNNALKSSFYYIPQIIYQSFYEKKVDVKLMTQIYNLSDTFMQESIQNRTDIPHLEFAICFALNYGRMNKEIIELSAYILKNYDLTNLKSVCFYHLFLAVYARALLETGEVEKALEIYEKVEFKDISIPEHMRYYLKIRLLLIQSEFLIYLRKTNKARRKLEEIKTLSQILQFRYFQNAAMEMEKQIVNVT